jgi:aspartate aminotransferase
MRISRRVERIPLSRTLALDTRAKELAAGGRDVVNLAGGEPDFDSPAVVRDAAKACIDGGRVRYTPAAGRASLREAIARHLTDTRGVPHEPRQVTVCHSCKHALSGVLLTLCEEGDDVLVPQPAWVSYVEQVRFAGATPVGVPPRPDMGPDFEALEAAVTSKAVGLMLNSPGNPSGYTWTRPELERLVDLARRHDLWILSDEIYSRMTFDGEPYLSPVQLGEDARARTVVVDGASKAFAMTGYRIGFVAGPPEVASAVARLHSQLTGAPNSVGQEAYEAALAGEPAEVPEMMEAFRVRRDHVVARLEAIGLRTPRPGGAFYAFPDISRVWPGGDGDAFCEALLEEEGLALVPGSAFGVPHHVRLCFAASLETLDDGLDRLARFVDARR